MESIWKVFAYTIGKHEDNEGYMEIYVVQEGDTIDTIADRYGSDVWQVITDNQLVYPYELAIGQALLLPGTARAPARSIYAGGYAYPFISSWVLDQTLPFLSNLFVFSYGFTAEGELLPPRLATEWMIHAAERDYAAAILTLTPFDTDGLFNNQLIHAVVNSQKASARLIMELLREMRLKGYRGVDIDFEFILPQDRDAFTAFVWNVRGAMRENSYHTSVALVPKTSADQVGLLYEGKDYRGLGEAADTVLLMTYEWGYTYEHLSYT